MIFRPTAERYLIVRLYVVSFSKYATELNELGVNIIIALGHSGVEIDQIIARDCPLVDIVVGGHSHTFLYSGENPSIEVIKGPYPIEVTQKSGKKVPVVQAYAFTKYMGQLTVTVRIIIGISVLSKLVLFSIFCLQFNENGDLTAYTGQPILLDNQIPNDDKETVALLEQYRPAIEELFKTVIGQTIVIRHKVT